MAIEVTRTYVGSIQNQRQVSDDLDSLGDSASKIWNVARWTADRIWDATGKIPDGGVLKSYMKNQACWKDLNAQSSQKVIEELSDAFQSWFDLRHKFDEANPPGYRKKNYYDDHGNRVHEEHPRSTVTWKQNGIRHDINNPLTAALAEAHERAVIRADERDEVVDGGEERVVGIVVPGRVDIDLALGLRRGREREGHEHARQGHARSARQEFTLHNLASNTRGTKPRNRIERMNEGRAYHYATYG